MITAKELYNKERYEECLGLLYQKSNKIKSIIWGLILFSYILSAISISITINLDSNNYVLLIVAAGAAGVAAGAVIAAGAAAGAAGVAAGAAGVAVGAAGVAAGADSRFCVA